MRERAPGVLLLVWACISPPVAVAGSDNSLYRLTIETPQDFRLRDDPAYRLVAPERAPAEDTAPAPPVSATVDLSGKPFSREIALAARESAMDAALLHAVIHVESRYQQRAVSPKGALGLMQVLPDTAARYGISDAGRSPRANLRAGTLYLRDLIQLFDGRLELALAAYNAGEGAVRRYAYRIPPYRETQHYVRAVLERYEAWGAPRSKSRTALMAAVPTVPPFIEYLSGTRLVLVEAPRYLPTKAE